MSALGICDACLVFQAAILPGAEHPCEDGERCGCRVGRHLPVSSRIHLPTLASAVAAADVMRAARDAGGVPPVHHNWKRGIA